MSIPPSYEDLGKAAKDIFIEGYHYGQFKVEVKTRTSSGVEFITNGSSDRENYKFTGNLETKYNWKDYGLTFNEKWNTDNSLSTELSVEDQVLKGSKLSLETKFTPGSVWKSGKIKTEYKRDYIHTNLDLDHARTLSVAAVVGSCKGWLAGCQLALNTMPGPGPLVSQFNFALGYSEDDFTLHASVNDGRELQGSIYHKVNDRLETAIEINSTTVSSDTKFGYGAKYSPHPDTTLRAMLNNASQIGLSYQHKITNGVTMTLSTLLEGRTLTQGGHKFGLALDFEP